MKITAILLLTGCLAASANGHTQNVTLNVKDAPIEKVFTELKRQTGYNFVYSNGVVKIARPINLVLNNSSFENALKLIFSGQPLSYSIVDKVVVIKIKPMSPKEPEVVIDPGPPPPIDVKGRVTNENGEPVAATVTVKGTNNATATDADGNFVLKGVDDNAVLVISGVSIETREIKVSGKTDLAIVAKTKVTSLNEVTINKGYYTEKRRFSVGNVSTVTAKDIEKQPVQNPLLALQGRVTGIQITQLTGLPGGGTKVAIQGVNSIRAGLNPLIVVDGVPFPSTLLSGNGRDDLVQGGSPLNYINPNDIESIDVLKDADATSIYGSRAANGAILITTKKGKAGKTKLSINIQQGWGKVNKKIDMMNTRQYLDMRYEAFSNDGKIPSNNSNASGSFAYAPDLTIWDTTRSTDWQKVLIGGTAKYTNVNASISGGNSAVQYLIGTTYNRQTTVFPGNFDDMVGGVHFNVSSNSTDKRLSVQLSGSYMYDENHLPGVDLTNRALLLEPIAPALYNANGTLNWEQDASGTSTWNNPLALIYGQDYNKTTKSLVGSLNLNYTILPGLTIGSSLGYTNMQSSNYLASRLEATAPEYRASSVRFSAFLNANMSNWIIEPQMKYTHKLGSGNFEGLVGASFQKQNGDWLEIEASGFANDQLMSSAAAAPVRDVLGAQSLTYKYNAFFGRLNYNWKEKYILNLTGRRDGSSRFGGNNKFHNFSSMGAAWIFSEEKFIQQNISFLSFGKLRGSIGTTGNDQISDYLYLSIYGAVNPAIPYQGGTGLSISRIPNPNLQWESTKKVQTGIDLGFLNDRILLGATYSRNQSSNQLLSYVLPSITGVVSINQNLSATIRNTSWEFTLHTVNLKRKDFNWTTDINLTIPRNKLVSFPGIEKTSYAAGTQGVVVGQPIGVVNAYYHGGVDPATGYYYPLDKNGIPVYFPNLANYNLDRTAIISPSTKFYGGFINTISYKKFQLEFVLQYVKQYGFDGFDYWNGNTYPGSFSFGGSNQPVTILNRNRWQKAGDIAEIGKYSIDRFAGGMKPNESDAGYSYNASFIRLKNVSLSWQAPVLWAKKIGLQSATVYFRGQNLATITKFKSLDPETRSNATLPPLQILTIGTKLDF